MLFKVPSSYVIMMGLTGASIGLVAALSKTSVSNTLIESILALVSGAAGLYFLNKNSLGKDQKITVAIGYMGIVFLSSLWVIFWSVAYFDLRAPLYYEWQDGPIIENLENAEIRGHLLNMGVRPQEVTDVVSSLRDEELGEHSSDILSFANAASYAACFAQDTPANEMATLVNKVLKGILDCNPDKAVPNQNIVRAAEILRHSFNSMNVGAIADGEQDAIATFQLASLSLLSLTSETPLLGRPLDLSCQSDFIWRGNNLDNAQIYTSRVQNCLSEETIVLNEVRRHAKIFADIWQEKVPATPSAFSGILERWDR